MTPQTYVLTNGIFIITSSMGIKSMSCVLLSGTATFKGNGNGFAGTPLTTATALNMVIGQPINVPPLLNTTSLEGVTIDASAGVVNILVSLS
jgi:hypothetical protein